MDFKYIAEPSMHSMPAVTLSPNGECSSRGKSLTNTLQGPEGAEGRMITLPSRAGHWPKALKVGFKSVGLDGVSQLLKRSKFM